MNTQHVNVARRGGLGCLSRDSIRVFWRASSTRSRCLEDLCSNTSLTAPDRPSSLAVLHATSHAIVSIEPPSSSIADLHARAAQRRRALWLEFASPAERYHSAAITRTRVRASLSKPGTDRYPSTQLLFCSGVGCGRSDRRLFACPGKLKSRDHTIASSKRSAAAMVAGTAPPVDHHTLSNWHTVRVVHTDFGALLVRLRLCQTLRACSRRACLCLPGLPQARQCSAGVL